MAKNRIVWLLILMIMYPDNLMVNITVVLSMLITVILAKTLGALLPMAAKALHLVPALMASPMLTTILDACSMVIYFTITSQLLHV